MAMAALPLLSDSALEAFLADIGFGVPSSPAMSHEENTTMLTPTPTSTAHAPATDDHQDDDEEQRRRRLRRRISNRESARRSRARKQRHLDEIRGKAAALRAGNRDLAARLLGARARAALVSLANAHLRDEAGALSRRLAAARRAVALRHLYAAASASAGRLVDLIGGRSTWTHA